MKTLAITAALILCSVSLFGSADLVTTVLPTPTVGAGFNASVFFQVRNNGPDTAPAVKLSISRPGRVAGPTCPSRRRRPLE